MMSGRILNRWSAFIFVKCVWADNMTQYFLCRCKDHTANSGYISDSFPQRTGTLFQSRALLFSSLKPIDVKISDFKNESFAKMYINTLKKWPNMGKVPLPPSFPNSLSDFFVAINVWFFFPVLPSLTCCWAISLTAGYHLWCLFSHPCPAGWQPPSCYWWLWVVPSSQERSKYMYVVQPEVPENSPFSILATSLPCSPFFILPLCHAQCMACALGDTQSQPWALDAFIVQQWVPSSPVPSSPLICSVLVAMSLIRIGFLLRHSPEIITQHSRATNKPLFPADSSPQPHGPCWRSVNG